MDTWTIVFVGSVLGLLGLDLEPQHVLPVLRLPLRVAFADDDLVPDRLDPKPRQRHPGRDLRTQPPQRPQNSRAWDLGLHQRLRRAQHDEVLEREAVFAARTPRRGHESRADQSANDGARQSKQPGDVAQ